ncbi:DUF4268 domain-containing protein [Halococcus sediminicola]|uniref:DUF4268 domain-containing protein n=1 Tax=Halococcus sediminicola TaxID=1264579 RepID=UPI0006795FF3|nr:DUF4268 domain-containing protein [Halococcus sediminicola]
MAEPDGPVFHELVPQNVREYWKHEAHNFTPWLANSIRDEEGSYLEDVLGLDLEVIETERSVGRYNLDILAEVVDDSRQVVIENQLEQSDHDHLGKSIAYAAGVDADIIVWIAPEFSDEHRDAFQWLNQNSREGIDLFAVRLEVWKISDSPPAIRLNPVEDPSEWKEKAQRSDGEISDVKQLQEEFWTQFRDRIEHSSTRLRSRTPKARHYYSNPIGKGGFHISFVNLFEEDILCLDLIIEDNEEAFWELKDEEDAIERELECEVEWEEPRETRGGNMRSNLRITRHADLENREKWEEYLDWLLEYGDRFHNVFRQRIQQF